MEGRARPPRHRPPRLRRVLRLGRAAAPARAGRQAGRRGGQRAARGRDDGVVRGAQVRRRLGVARGAGAPAVPAGDLHPARLRRPTGRSRARSGSSLRERLPVVQQVGLDEGYADVTECREAAARAARARRRGARPHGHHDVRRRRAQPADREGVLAISRSRRGSWRWAARRRAGGWPARRCGSSPASGRRPPSGWRRSASPRSARCSRPTRTCSPSASAPATGATCVARAHFHGSERRRGGVRAGQVALQRDDVRPRHRRPRRAGGACSPAWRASWPRACSASRCGAARSRSRCASTTGPRSRARARSRRRSTTRRR